VRTESAGAVDGSTPDSVSAGVQCTVTLALYQPAAFGDVVAAPVSEGATRSMLIPLTVVLAELSALSETVPVRDWFAPSVPTVAVAATLAASVVNGPLTGGCAVTPEPESVATQLTVTPGLFHPATFGAGLTVGVRTGPVLSLVYDAVVVLGLPLQPPALLPLP